MEISRKQKKTLLTGGFGEKDNDRLSFGEVANLFFKESIRQENEDKARREAAKKSGSPADLFFYNSGLPEEKKDTDKDMEALNRIKEGYPNTDIEKANNNKLTGKFYGEIQKNSKMPDNGKNQFIDLTKDPKEYLPGDKNKKLIEGINKPSEFSLENTNNSPKVTRYWDDTGHNYIIDRLNYPKDDAALMRHINREHDKWSQGDPIAHAMPFMQDEGDYVRIATSDYSEFSGTYSYNGNMYNTKEEAEAAARQQYDSDKKQRRVDIRDRCTEHLKKAVECKNQNDRDGAIDNLTKALHIVTDDRAHRQAQAGWVKHIPRNKVKTRDNQYTTPKPDNMFNPDNTERFDEAGKAAHVLNEMYRTGKIDYIKLDELFPQV